MCACVFVSASHERKDGGLRKVVVNVITRVISLDSVCGMVWCGVVEEERDWRLHEGLEAGRTEALAGRRLGNELRDKMTLNSGTKSQ